MTLSKTANTSPAIVVNCQQVLCRAASVEALYRGFPGWDKPGGGFARPGIDECAARRAPRGRS
ncbi:MAG: hypothetical protein KF774_09125 [Planctomyces sp.]|nr:hypothetical protein [Planctomyces sp.]